LFKNSIAVRRPLVQNQLHLQERRPSARLFKNGIAVRKSLLPEDYARTSTVTGR
jgi:hypothetical protein